MWQVWTSSWCTHHTRAVTRRGSQGSKADYNKSRQLKNSQQQLWAWTCHRFTRWGSLVSPSNVVASVLGGLQNLLGALGSAEDSQGVQQHIGTKQSCFLAKSKFTCKRKKEMTQPHTSNFHFWPLNNLRTLFALSLFYSHSQKIQASPLSQKTLLDPPVIKSPTSSGSLRLGQKDLNSPKFYLPEQESPFYLCKEHSKGNSDTESTLKAKQLWPQLLPGLGGRFSFPVALYE